jgi:hypothetical protein
VVVLAAILSLIATFLYCDGHDRPLGAVLKVIAAVSAIGFGLALVSAALTNPASSVPECTYRTEHGQVVADCESTGEASRRAAGEAGSDFVERYIVGPIRDGAIVFAAGLVGMFAARATARRPTDGRRMRVITEEPPEGPDRT